MTKTSEKNIVRLALEWLKELRRARPAVQERTREAYQRDIEHLLDFLSERGISNVQRITPALLTEFMQGMTSGQKTLERRRNTIRRWLEWTVERGVIRTNPAKQLRVEHGAEQQPRWRPTEAELEAVRDRSLRGKRDRAIMVVMMVSDGSFPEIWDMDEADVDLAGSKVSVHGATFSVDEPKLEVLSDYLAARQSISATTSLWITANRHSGRGRDLTLRGIQESMRRRKQSLQKALL